MRERTGSIFKRKDGKLYVRVTYIDSTTGKRRELVRRAENRKEARTALKKLLQQTEHETPNLDKKIEGERMSFSKLAETYIARKVILCVPKIPSMLHHPSA
jgi:hypothetical protein